MMFFCNIPKKGCISGKIIPTLSIRMGAEGDSNTAFPDSGRPLVWIGASWWGSGPCSSIAGDWFLADHNAQDGGKARCFEPYRMRRVREHGRGGSCPNLLLLPGFGPTTYYSICRLSGSNHLVRLSWPDYQSTYTYPTYPTYQTTYTPQYYQTAYTQPAQATYSTETTTPSTAAPAFRQRMRSQPQRRPRRQR